MATSLTAEWKQRCSRGRTAAPGWCPLRVHPARAARRRGRAARRRCGCGRCGRLRWRVPPRCRARSRSASSRPRFPLWGVLSRGTPGAARSIRWREGVEVGSSHTGTIGSPTASALCEPLPDRASLVVEDQRGPALRSAGVVVRAPVVHRTAGCARGGPFRASARCRSPGPSPSQSQIGCRIRLGGRGVDGRHLAQTIQWAISTKAGRPREGGHRPSFSAGCWRARRGTSRGGAYQATSPTRFARPGMATAPGGGAVEPRATASAGSHMDRGGSRRTPLAEAGRLGELGLDGAGAERRARWTPVPLSSARRAWP